MESRGEEFALVNDLMVEMTQKVVVNLENINPVLTGEGCFGKKQKKVLAKHSKPGNRKPLTEEEKRHFKKESAAELTAEEMKERRLIKHRSQSKASKAKKTETLKGEVAEQKERADVLEEKLKSHVHSFYSLKHSLYSPTKELSETPDLKKRRKSRASRTERALLMQDRSQQYPKNWEVDFFPRFFNDDFKLQDSDFLLLKFDRITGIPSWDELVSEVEIRVMYESTFKGLRKICQAIPPLTCVYLVNSLLESMKDEPNALHHWGHSTSPIDSQSKRCYSFPDHCINSMRKQQAKELEKMFLQQGCIVDDKAASKLDAAFDFLSSKCIKFKKSLDHEFLCFTIACALGWQVDDLVHALQFNFQHQTFPPHIDDSGFLQQELRGGDGFGKQIGIAQLRGKKAMFYVAGIVPEVFPAKILGVKFELRTGDIVGLEQSARSSCVHGVVSCLPGGTHQETCRDCKMTATLRNGFEFING